MKSITKAISNFTRGMGTLDAGKFVGQGNATKLNDKLALSKKSVDRRSAANLRAHQRKAK